LSATEEYELAAYDRHELNYDNVALGRLPYKVTQDPMVTPLREFGYLPKGVIDPHDLPAGSKRPGLRPEEMVAQMETNSQETAK
jgi:NAD(P)H-quinone oxidoreductase subunit I